ncbi:hypothetical protein EON65_07145 [archaeon]|nr:MAG: hypothetical protein EON65_07145 [archaeon]
MLILLVNGYSDDVKSQAAYQYTFTFLRNIFKKAGNQLHDHYFMERSYTELGDLVIDWEHAHLDKKAQENSVKFDKIDMIIVCGDMHVLPWETFASQVVSLLHMAKFMSKPVMALGFGAFSAIYTFATKGVRFNVLNGPTGQPISELSSFPRYSVGTGAHPSGWLDRETGDMYVYEAKNISWQPKCNLGIHFSTCSSGSSGSPRGQPPVAKHVSYHDMSNPSELVYRSDSNRATVRFTNRAIQSYLLKGIAKSSHHFVVDMIPDWCINRQGALPTHENLLVVGECDKAPLILLRDRMLLVGCKIQASDRHNVETMEKILLNFVNEMLSLSVNNSTDKIELSISEFLFGLVEMGHGKYDTLRDRAYPMTSALSKLPVKSSLTGGPVKVDAPVFDMFFRMPTNDEVDYFALTSKRQSSSMGKRPKVAIQNPLNLNIRKMRLEAALGRIGVSADSSLVEKGLLIGFYSNPDSMSDNMPNMNRDILSGVVMKENSISTRRHHKDIRNAILTQEEIRQLDYNTFFPLTPKITTDSAVGALAISLETADREALRSSPRILDAGMAISPRNGARRVRVHSPTSPKTPSNMPSKPTSPNQRSDMQSREDIYNMKKPEVPPIPYWDRIFLTPHQTTALNADIQSSSRSRTTSPRSGNTSANRQSIPITPWSPAPPQSSAPSSAHTVRTPRNARTILHEALNNHCLPIQRPHSMLRKTKHLVNPEDNSDEEDEEEEEPVLAQNPYSQQPAPEEVVLITDSTGSHRSNYKELTKKFCKLDSRDATHYEGYYTNGYMTVEESMREELRKTKENCLAGDFKVHFSPQKSAMSPRPEAGIRSEGPYPKPPAFGHPANMKANEWPFLSHNPESEAQQRWVAGAWKR